MEQIDLNATDWVSNTPNIYYTAVSGFVKLAGESEISTYISRATFVGGQVISTTVNLVKDPDNPGKVIVSTVVAGVVMYFVADTIIAGIAVVAAAAVAAVTGTAATVVVVAIAAIAVAVVAIAATFAGNELQSVIYDGLDSFEKGTIISPEITGSFTQQEFILQSLNDNPNFCMDAFPDYVNYRQIVTIKNYNGETLAYNMGNKTGTIDASDIEHIKDYLHTLYDTTDANKVALNSITYDITNGDNLLVRNAIFDIPKVSFLLSHILIKTGDILDIGDQGLYKVSSGDTMSEIAEAHGMSTQELLSYNTWLIDDGRVTFDQDKVLVANLEPSDFTNKDHNLKGCELEDRLIDHNDGNDTLLGMGGDDYLEGGKGADQLVGGSGFDTYVSDGGDIIFDEDGKGEVYFDKSLLTGGKIESGGGSCDTPSDDGDNSDDPVKPIEYKGDGGVYTYEKGVLTFTKNSGEVLVINNFKNGDLGITLESDGGGEDPCPPPPTPPTPTPPTPPSPGLPVPPVPYHHGSPLVFDLNGDGITSTFIYKTSTYFDLDNDGIIERTGWVQGSDGLLALDKNNDGIINNGNELFGNYTKDSLGKYANNGFDALAKYDDNHDGVIDAKDNIYKALKVWQDVDSDGITDDGELKTLSELGISSINLSYVTADALEERNSIRETSTFTTQSTDENGNVTTQVNIVNDVWFDRDVKDTKSTTNYTQISNEIKLLGNVSGSGDVEDLAIAMSKDSVLMTKVETLVNAIQNGESLNSLETLTKDILVRWSGTENITGINDWMSAAYSHIAVTNQDVAIVEKFNGEGFYTNINGAMTRGVLGAEAHFYIRDMNEYLVNKALMSIYAHTVFGDSIVNENGYLSLSELKSAIQQALSEDSIDVTKLDAITNIVQIWNEMLGENASMSFIEELGFSEEKYHNQYVLLERAYTNNHGGDADNVMRDIGGNDIFYGQDGNDKIFGGNGHDELYGGDGDDYIDGGWGMDVLYGGDGNDTLIDGLGMGNDVLIGGKGEDTIMINGAADIVVYNYGDGNDTISCAYLGANTLVAQGIRFEDIKILRVGNDMVIQIIDQFNNQAISGSVTIKNQYICDTINAFVFEDQTLDFAQIRYITEKIDDTYIFNIGDENLIILDPGSINGDTLKFGSNITPNDIIVQAVPNSNDFIIAIKEDGKTFDELSDKITIKNWFDANYRIENFEFEDGTILDVNGILNLQVGSDSNDSFRFLSSDINIDTFSGDDNITTAGGNDTINAGNGNDIVNSGNGNDVIYGGDGNDILNGGNGNDTYIFNCGDGQDIISDYGYHNSDAIKFGSNITPNDIVVQAVPNSNDLIIAIKEDGKTFDELSDKITIKNWFNENYRIENFEFEDGTILDVNGIFNLQVGSDSNDSLRFLSGDIQIDTLGGNDNIITGIGNDTINTGNGNDIVNSGNGNDVIYGGDGNDTISSEAGNDILSGGLGNDNLNGGAGNDIYVFNKGDGQDIISDTSGIDTIYFGDGITQNNLIIFCNESNNFIKIIIKNDDSLHEDTSDSIKIINWQTNYTQIEKIEFSDGSIAEFDDIVKTAIKIPYDVLIGTNQADTLNGEYYAEVFYGKFGNDTINAQAGNDVLSGGIGNDVLNGGAGNDIYLFNIGDGADTIIDVSGIDTIKFGPDITSDSLIVRVIPNSNDLIIALKEDGKAFDELTDKITIKNWFDINYRIENFEFEDGTLLGVNDIITLKVTEEDDILNSLDSSASLNVHMLDGNDYVQGSNTDDIIYGDAGSDTINAQAGNDILSGGLGNDTLNGGNGNDTYIFNRGDGQDIISDIGTYKPYYPSYTQLVNGGTDTIQFGEGITAEDIIIKTFQNINDIIIAIKEDGKTFDELTDKITIKNWFDEKYRIENITFEDGTIWNVNDIISTQVTNGDDAIESIDINLSINIDLLNGNDVFVSGNADDIINGNIGNDTLNGGGGNDTYIFNRGDGQDIISDIGTYKSYYSSYTQLFNGGTDTIQFGEGITADDIIIKTSQSSNDIIIAIKEDGKTFDELTDKITIKNWFDENYRIENITFEDGTIWNVNDIINAQGTNEADTVHLLNNTDDVNLNLQGGNDNITTVSGNDTINAGSGDDMVNSAGGNDTIDGGEGNDIIKAGSGDDVLLGGLGNDTLNGEDGNDTLNGGIGNDMLNGGKGNDVYIFAKGDSMDIITDISGNDTIQFGEGITADDIIIQLSQNNSNLIIALKEDGVAFNELADKITIKSWLSEDYRVENIIFSDGTIWNASDIINAQGTEYADIVRLINNTDDVNLNLQGGNDNITTASGNDTINGGSGDDIVFAQEGNDTIYGGDGNDTIYAGIGNDILNGEEGNDTLNGEDGNDTINGGSGDDKLYGGYGDDIYLFNRNDGIDTLLDYSGNDTIQFGEGITVADIIVQASHDNNYNMNDLVITIKEDGKTFDELTDKIIIKNWYLEDERIETFIFNDGTKLDIQEILGLQIVNDDDNYLRYLNGNDVVIGEGGDDTIYTQDGNDTVSGGIGNDNIYDYDGDDTYLFNRGDGIDHIFDSGGLNKLIFGDGVTSDEIEVHMDKNYLIIAIKENGKTFDELSDKIYFNRLASDNHDLNSIIFSDGSSVDPYTLLSSYDGTDGNDNINLDYLQSINPLVSIDDSLVINAKDGNDTVIVGNGANIINMGDSANYINIVTGDYEKLYVGDGNNQIDMGTGWYKTLNAGNGNNTVVINSYDTTVVLGGGNNTIINNEDANIYLGNGDNTISANGYYTSITAGDGSNTVCVDKDTYKSVDINLGEGNNTIIDQANETMIGDDGHGTNFAINVGNGANLIQFGEQKSEDSGEDKIYRNINITAGDGANQILINNGDDNLTINAGSGNNNIRFSSDVDNVLINVNDGNNTITQLEDTDIEHSYYDWIYDESTGESYQSDELIVVSNPNNLNITIGNGLNAIALTDVAQDYKMTLGDGDNIVTIGKEGSDNNYAMKSGIMGGDGNNQLSILSGDGQLDIGIGDGNNTIVFSGDIDNVNIEVGDGDNIINQIPTIDTDISSSATLPEEYYIAQDVPVISVSNSNDINDENNQVAVAIGLGSNHITLGASDDSVYFSEDAYEQLNYGASSKTNTIDVGAGSNYINLVSSTNQNIIVGAENYSSLSTYAGYDYTEVYLGNGNNTVDIKGADELYAELGSGGNNISINNTNITYLGFAGGTNAINIENTDSSFVSIGQSYGDETKVSHIMQGYIENVTEDTVSIDHWIFDYAGGNLQIDIYTEMGGDWEDDAYSASNYADINDDGIQEGIDSIIYLYHRNENGDWDIVASNDDSSDGFTDGSYSSLDSYLNVDLDAGEYMLSVSVCCLSSEEALSDSQSNDYAGPYQITFNDSVSFLDIPSNAQEIYNYIYDTPIQDQSLSVNYVYMDESSTLFSSTDAGRNIVSTGAGNDDIFTYNSDDTYMVNIGNGSDAILDMQGIDKIVFGEGISKDNIKVWVEFNGLENYTDNAELIENYQYEANIDNLNPSLIIQYTDNPDDVLILLNWYGTDSRIEQFEFSDGSILSDHQIVSLIGTDEPDIIIGTESDNTLQGGAEADTISGDAGNDIYIFNRGDSHDTVNENGGFDTISFGSNITKDDLILEKVDNSLLISLKEDGKTTNELSDTIMVNDWFDANGQIERLVFADGTSIELDEMLNLVGVDETIYYGTPEVDTMEGTDASDIIMARESDDIINGNEGNDSLFGEAGDDTLNGGDGNDLLYGGEGNDIYIVDKNMGNDIIFDQSGNDTIQFAQGITSDDIIVSYAKHDLNISLDGTNIIITNWYNESNRVEIFSFADGQTLDINAIINLQYGDVKGVVEGTLFEINDGNDTAYLGQNGNDIFYAETNSGNNTIVDSGGHDTIIFTDGITPEMLSLSYSGNDLIVSFEGTALCISGWYTAQNRIETFEFENGVKLNVQNIINLMSTDGNDTIRSLEEGSIVDGGEGNDTIQGGSGRDTLLGENGSDTYLFGYGSGHDVIFDAGGDSSEIDSVIFNANIKPENVIFQWEQSTDNLIIYLADPNNLTILDAIEDRITIQDWYKSDNRIESFVFADGTVIDTQGVIEKLVTNGNDLIRGVDDSATIINALDGNDEIYTYGGNDILSGGKGNDLLAGQQGDDTYIFNRGDGIDTIIDRATHIWDERNENDSGNDKIVFGEGITIDDISVSWDKDTNDLIIGIIDPQNPNKTFDELSDKIIIREWFNPSSRIESISFADGSTINTNEIYNLLATDGNDDIRALDEGGVLNGYDGNDILRGSMGDDILIGENGNDTLLGNQGDDILIGGNGDDLLQGEDGNDILDGGEGNNVLEGGNGNDSYVFGYESGKTIVYDSAYILDTTSTREDDYVAIDGGVDIVYFGEGITIDDLIVSNDGYDLIITLKNSTDSELRIQDYYKSFNTIESFGFSDGSIIESSEIEALLFTPNNDNVTFVDDKDRIINGNDGDDTINGGSGNDIIDGAGGDDILNGGFGNDTYVFGRGSGHDTIIDDGIGEWWQTQSGSDNILFKDGITNDDLWTKRDGNDIIIGIKEDNKSFDELKDTLRIVGAFDEANPFESFTFENGETVAIESIAQSVAPVATDDTIQAVEDIPFISTVSLIENDSDVDGDNLNIVAGIFTTTQGGSIDIKADGSYTYTPASNFNGVDTFEYTLTDGELTDTATLTLNVQAVNDAPVAQNATATLDEDTILNTILPTANDVDGDSLTYSLQTNSSHGNVVINPDGSYNYTPNSNYYGADSFVYLVSDGNGGQTTATIDLTINSIIDDMTIYGTNKKDTLRGDQIDVRSNDTIYGLNGNDTIYGLGGNDILDGGNGNDKVYGGDGNDIIYASMGRDYLDGGSGTDTLSYANYTHGVVGTLNSSYICDWLFGRSQSINFENLEGSKYNDILTGDSQNNTIYGLSGNDTLNGGKGDDTLYGGTGKDILYGGSGNDVFVIDSLNKLDIDSILDFSSKDDTIYLDNSIFTSLINEGTLDSSNFVSNKSGTAIDSDDYIIYETDTGKLFYDADGSGDGAAIQIATLYGLSNQNTLTYSDFMVI